MWIALLNPFLAWGLAAAVIPIVLHLWLRAKPKRLIFPALQLLKKHQQKTIRRMQVKHFWLMLLRMLMIAALVLALMRPTLPPANYFPTFSEWGIGLAILVVVVAAAWAYGRFISKPERSVSAERQRVGRIRFTAGAMAILALLAFSGWPYTKRLAAEIKDPPRGAIDQLPVAAALVFDTSPSMEYQFEQASRLDVAKASAIRLIERFPPGSKVAAVNSAEPELPPFGGDLVAARNRVQGLKLSTSSRPLNEALRTALKLHEADMELGGISDPKEAGRDRAIREIYLFTDMRKSAWQFGGDTQLKAELEKLKQIGLFVIDVGQPGSQNAGVGQIRLAPETVIGNGLLNLEASIWGTRVEEAPAIELLLTDESGKLVRKSQQLVSTALSAAPIEPAPNPDSTAIDGISVPKAKSLSSTRLLSFAIDGLAGSGDRQGELRFVGSDPIAADDRAYFTVRVKPPPKVLVVGSQIAAAALWSEALAPTDLVTLGRAKYNVTVIEASQLAGQDLSQFDAVTLINVPRLAPAIWTKLNEFVRGGKGLFVALGNSSLVARRNPQGIDPTSYNTAEAKSVLAAIPKASLRFSTPTKLSTSESVAPIFKKLDEIGGLAELQATDFRRYWAVEPAGDATVLANFITKKSPPALVARNVGKGRSLLWASAVDGNTWNDLPVSWVYVALADLITQDLLGVESSRVNFEVGEDARRLINLQKQATTLLLREPGFTQRRIELAADAFEVSAPSLPLPGHYQVESLDGERPFQWSFSANFPPAEFQEETVFSEDLSLLLGEKRFVVAKDPETLERAIDSSRLGQEIYGLVLMLMIAIFIGEHLLANWFYELPNGAPTAQATTA